MIPQINELNLPSYATLHAASVTMNEMGEKVISAQVRIDGDIVPSFVGTDGQDWTLEFRGERFILPIREPQATKSSDSRYSLVDLTFYDWASYQLKRHYFVEMASTNSGTAIADKYEASLALNLANFCAALQNVLTYYYGTTFRVKLNPSAVISVEPTFISISYSYIWDVLQQLNELFDIRWSIKYNKEDAAYDILIGYTSEEVSHIFEYGYEGGLLKFERQVQSDDIKNIILGRGGDKNLPKLYFKDYSKYKPAGSVVSNGLFTPDPDAIPELMNIYFSQLRDSNFRKYVRGWKAQKKYDGATYQPNQGWAYEKGYTDKVFNPVEYVKDDASIAKYGERWGALDANDDIYPSIQDVSIAPYDRIDEVVAVSAITSDDREAAATDARVITNVEGVHKTEFNLEPYTAYTWILRGPEFTVPEGQVGQLDGVAFASGKADVPELVIVDRPQCFLKAYRVADSVEQPVSALPAGTYYYIAQVRVENRSNTHCDVTYGYQSMKVTSASVERDEWKPTFDIWVKNIWETSPENGETPQQYADRVWRPILGDREGNGAAVVFSTGMLSVSSDYEFPVVGYAYDTSKTLDGVQSHWRLTLAKSDAELDATGLYLPNASTGGNASAGDKFFFIGIDMPFVYVKWAEDKLTAFKETEGLGKSADINPTWLVTLDKVRTHTPDSALFGQQLADMVNPGVIVNVRDKRFTRNDVLQLYVRSVTFSWQEPTKDAPYIVPDIEIVLSDKIVAVKSAVSELQGEVSAIKKQYVSYENLSQAVAALADASYLKKTGISDISYSPTEFAASVTSKEFRQGDIGGRGWGAYTDGTGAHVIEADKLVVRQQLRVNELVVNQVSYMGGKQIISAAAITCSQVDDTPEGYVCHFDQKQGTVANLFKVGDVAYGQVFSSDNLEMRSYKRKVVAIDVDSITLSKTIANGDGVPQRGDTVVQFGSYTDNTRQYVIIRDVIGGGYERMLSGLTSVDTNGSEYYFAGRLDGSSPRWFVGNKQGAYAEYVNGELTINAKVNFRSGSSGLSNLPEWAGVSDSINEANALAEAASGLATGAQEAAAQAEKAAKDAGDLAGSAQISADDAKRTADSASSSANQAKKDAAAAAQAARNAQDAAKQAAQNIESIQKTVDEMNDDGFLDVNEKALIRTKWENIHGPADTVRRDDYNLGTYWRVRHTFDEYAFPSTASTFLYNGTIYRYADKAIVYRMLGFEDLDLAYELLRVYLESMQLYESTISSGYDREVMARKFTAYYEMERTVSDRIVIDNKVKSDDLIYLTSAFSKLEDFETTIDGGVVLSKVIGVRDGNKMVAGLNATTAATSGDQHGRLLLFAGTDETQQGLPARMSNARFRVYEDGQMYARGAVMTDLTAKGATIEDLSVEGARITDATVYGTIRHPFVSWNGYIDIEDEHPIWERYDSFIINGGDPNWPQSVQLAWDASQIGRTVFLTNYIYDGAESAVRTTSIGAPANKYFFEHGAKLDSLKLSGGWVELKGYGVGDTFYGWIVVARGQMGRYAFNHIYRNKIHGWNLDVQVSTSSTTTIQLTVDNAAAVVTGGRVTIVFPPQGDMIEGPTVGQLYKIYVAPGATMHFGDRDSGNTLCEYICAGGAQDANNGSGSYEAIYLGEGKWLISKSS